MFEGAFLVRMAAEWELAANSFPVVFPAIREHWTCLEGTIIFQPLAAAMTSAYLPLLAGDPVEVTGNGTIFIYRGHFDFRQLAAFRRLQRGTYYLYRDKDPSRAEVEFEGASRFCPESNRVDLELGYTFAMTAQERWDEANFHAQRILKLTENNPTYRSQRQIILDALEPKP